jgi:hypothetical protein
MLESNAGYDRKIAQIRQDLRENKSSTTPANSSSEQKRRKCHKLIYWLKIYLLQIFIQKRCHFNVGELGTSVLLV